MGHAPPGEGRPQRGREDQEPGARPRRELSSGASRAGLVAAGALAAVALALLAILLAYGGGDPEPDGLSAAERPPRRVAAVDRLPLERQVGELLLMSFDETEVPDYIRRRLARGEGAGVVLFERNAPDADTTTALTEALQDAAGGRALIATDQEGGTIRTLPFAGPEAGQAELSTPELARDAATEGAEALSDLGLNVTLAPVLDTELVAGSLAAGRAYPGDSEAVADAGRAAVRAYARGGVAATAKHFPGLGRATANTDDTSVSVEVERGDLDDDLAPFRAAVEARAGLVMVSHASYPALDDERIASQSPAILRDLLRDDVGYRGVVVTDSLEAQAVLETGDIGSAAVRSIAAGVDLVLMTGSGSWNEVYPRVLARAKRDRAFRARVRRSAARVLALKRRLGLPSPRGRAGQAGRASR